MEEQKFIDLTNLGNGTAVERFEDGFKEVLENCMDVNTVQKRVRKVILEVTLLPNEERTEVAMSIKCETKLSPPSPVESIAFIGRKDGIAIAVEHNPEQERLFENNNELEQQRKDGTND